MSIAEVLNALTFECHKSILVRIDSSEGFGDRRFVLVRFDMIGMEFFQGDEAIFVLVPTREREREREGRMGPWARMGRLTQSRRSNSDRRSSEVAFAVDMTRSSR